VLSAAGIVAVLLFADHCTSILVCDAKRYNIKQLTICCKSVTFVEFPGKHMQELVLSILQFNITVPPVRKEGLLLKTRFLTQEKRKILEMDMAKENKI